MNQHLHGSRSVREHGLALDRGARPDASDQARSERHRDGADLADAIRAAIGDAR